MAYPSPRHALLLSVLFVVVQVVLGSLGFPYSERLALIATELTLILLLAFFFGWSRSSSEDVLLLNATSLGTILASLFAAIGAALLVAELDVYVSELFSSLHSSLPVGQQRYVIGIQLVDNVSDGLIVFATLVLAPAVCEEVFFRGFVFTALAARHGAAAAILGTAFLFAAIHFNPWQFPALVLLGIFLGVLVYVTHSIYPAIVAHMVTNGLSVLGINLRAHTGQDVLAASDHLPLVLLLVAVVLVWSGLRIVHRQHPIMPLLRSGTRRPT
jgi:membrane protease YdiL (CAAX protease family)